MGRDKKTPDRTELTLPKEGPGIRLAAPADQPAARFEGSQPVTLIGSRRDCDLFVNRDDVSKVHCALVNTGTAVIVVDLCSRCGTFVNGQQISTTAIHPGDELCVGSAPVEVEFLDASGEPAGRGAGADEVDLALSAPLRLTASEQEYELMALPAVIGRRHACQVLLDTPDVSLAHALLFTIEGFPAIFDLGSRSGTILNGQRVTLAWLRDGDQLCIGGEELTLSWSGPQAVKTEEPERATLPAADTAKGPSDRARGQRGVLAETRSVGARVRKEADAPPMRTRKRAATLDEREARLEARTAALEAEWARLAAEKQQMERQAAELRAAAAELEQDRAWLETQRAQFERERAQFEAQQGDAKRQSSRHEKTLDKLRGRAAALDQREAALAAAEQEMVERQAELAKREAANAEAVRRIEQLREALSDAQRMFASAATASARIAAGGRRGDTPADPASASGQEQGGEGDSLPAPLVGEPLFAGLDPSSPERWPPELQERLRLIGRATGRCDADVIAQVLAEYRAQHSNDRTSPGN